MENLIISEEFIKEYERKEKEKLKAETERLKRNPMCLKCSQYFLGCNACEH